MRAKLPRSPSLPSSSEDYHPNTHSPLQEDGFENDDEDDEAEELLDVMPELVTPLPKKRVFGAHYSPVSASQYFSQALEVETDQGAFRVYYTPPETNLPLSSINQFPSESLSFEENTLDFIPTKAPWALEQPVAPPPIDEDDDKTTLFVCIHGAAYSGLAWACFAKSLADGSAGRAGVWAWDARGHGQTSMLDPSTETDLSQKTLTNDLVSVLCAMFPDKDNRYTLILLGHSMGGSIATHAAKLLQEAGFKVVGLIVIDVVEGTALDALPAMESVIDARPKGFRSIEEAVSWHLQSNTLRNIESARVSVKGNIIENSNAAADSTAPDRYLWRVNLKGTKPFWEGWFKGLSSTFLSAPCPKLLLLAGSDRLDKELLVGQMQGKYQLEVFTDVGHCVQEDAPARTAKLVHEFWKRNDRGNFLKNVKKVGEV